MTARPEQALQRQTAAYFAAVLNPALVLFLHVPNEGKRGRFAQADFKLGGGLAGVPDWMLSWRTGQDARFGEGHAIAWLELKSPTAPKKLPAAQEVFRQRVLGLEHYHAVARDLGAVAIALRAWGVPMRPHKMLPAGNGWQIRGRVEAWPL